MNALTCSNCGGELSVIWNLERLKDEFPKRDGYATGGIWAYRKILPLENPEKFTISLREGGTPLLRCERLGRTFGLSKLFVKDETRNPTGSFKDRGISVAVSKALESGARDIVCASTGNLGASVAAYSAAAGLNAHIFLPASTPKSKVTQTLAYGATVHSVDGITSDKANIEALKECKSRGWYPMRSNPKWNPYPMEGSKTITFEIVEQLSWREPDYILTGVGSGTNLASNWKALTEMRTLGLSNPRSALVGIQADGCMPFVDAIKRGLTEEMVRSWPNPNTITSGLADAYPNTCLQAMEAVRKSGGTAISVVPRSLLQGSTPDFRSPPLFFLGERGRER